MRSRKALLSTLSALAACTAMIAAASAQPLPPPPPNTSAATPAPAAPVKPKKPKPKPKTPLAFDKKPLVPAPGTSHAPPATGLAPAPGTGPGAASMAPRPPGDIGTSAPPASAAPLSKSAAALDPRQRAIVERISAYLTNLRTLIGEFKQVAPDGSRTQGEFYLMRPGKLRFEYADPSPILLVADGRSVIVRDRNLATQDEVLISQTPLRFLLADRVDLLRDTNIVAVYGDNIFNTVVIEESQIMRGNYRVMLMFDAQRGQLKQWVVTDPQGQDTTVAVFNLDTTTKPDPDLFRIDHTRYVR